MRLGGVGLEAEVNFASASRSFVRCEDRFHHGASVLAVDQRLFVVFHSIDEVSHFPGGNHSATPPSKW